MNKKSRSKYDCARFPAKACRGCGKVCDAATCVFDETARPKAGSVNICMQCGLLSVYTNDCGGMREPTAADLAAWRNDPDTWRQIQGTRLAIAVCGPDRTRRPRIETAEVDN